MTRDIAVMGGAIFDVGNLRFLMERRSARTEVDAKSLDS